MLRQFKLITLLGTVTLMPNAALDAAPEIDAASTTVNFRIGGVNLTMPMPEGYCKPKGRDIDVAQLMAAADTQNVTHFSAIKCDDDGAMLDYILFKTPSAALLANMERAEFLKEISAAFASPEVQAALKSNKISSEVSRDFERVLNVKVSIDAAIEPRGNDDECGYVGGYGSFTDVPKPYRIALGMCMTTVVNKVISVNVYGKPKDANDVANLMSRARQIALSIKASDVQ
jgi:hypothetical protein